MTLICGSCGFENLDGLNYCEACGEELTDTSPAVAVPAVVWEPTLASGTVPSNLQLEESEEFEDPTFQPSYPSVPVVASTVAASTTLTPARLVAKTAGSPIPEFPLTEESCIVGKFDPDLGPVEVDLENFPNADYISRNHARVFWDRGQWKVEDNDSANGVFLKKSNESRFTKITTAEVLEAGDEVSFAKIRFTFQF